MPQDYTGEFVAHMEDILETYALPYDSQIPLVCMDEQPCRLLGDVVEPLPMEPGKVQKVDYQYSRGGPCSVFVFVEPLGGWRHVEALKRRTKLDWVHQVERLLLEFYPKAEKVRLVLDNLNTHVLSSLYLAFPAEKARSLARRLEFHYTPKHGSWFNVAELELSALTRQCLDRRIPDIEALNKQLSIWEADRNGSGKQIDWHFTTKQARGKLKYLYHNL
ncbi:MAG: IS630 family transposase [Candidatus Bathyarchaeota archaeon]|nr:IS630 family transposase [Candidatus Termiticorpusculum sp.]